jgi:UDP-N-acetyl-D-mannosaminuronate dehydrogenase
MTREAINIADIDEPTTAVGVASSISLSGVTVKGARTMRVSIFGLGYVGTVSAGCFAKDGHVVVGVDPVPAKLDLISKGLSPIVEAEIGDIIAEVVGSGKL